MPHSLPQYSADYSAANTHLFKTHTGDIEYPFLVGALFAYVSPEIMQYALRVHDDYFAQQQAS